MIKKLSERPLPRFKSKVTDVELFDKIQELIDAHNELEKNTLDTFNHLLTKLQELL